MAENKYQLLVDFIINLKNDKSQLTAYAEEVAATMSKIQPNIKINKDELVTQISAVSNYLNQLIDSGGNVNDVLSSLSIAVKDDNALEEINNLLDTIDKIEETANNVDLSGMTDNLDFSNIDTSAINEAFANVDPTLLAEAFAEAGRSLDELTVQAEQSVQSQLSALQELAGSGNYGTEEYRLLEAELQKTIDLTNQLTTAAGNTSIIKLSTNQSTEGGNITYKPVLDKSGLKEEAKKGGEEAGTELASGVKKTFSMMNPKELMGGILSVFGGSALMGGVQGIVGGFEQVLEAGKKSLEMTEYLELGFKQAGLSGKGLEKQMESTSKFAGKLSNEFAVGAGTVREYSQQAAFLGGATGKQNEALTTLAVGIEKASRGMVSGSQVVRTFSRGLGDPEAVANLGRLKLAFPQLATALQGIKEPAEMTKKALDVLNPTFDTLKEQAKGPLGTMERLENTMKATKTALGKDLISALAPFLTEIGNKLIPVIKTGISGISAFGKVIQNNVGPIKATATAIALLSVAMWAANGGFIKLATSAGEMAIKSGQAALNIIKKLIPSLVTETAVATETTAAQYALNTAVLANPYVLAAAAIVALVIAMKLMIKTNSELIAEKMKETQANIDSINSQEKILKKNIDMEKSQQNLVKTFKEQGKSAMENSDLMIKLAQAYPGVIDQTKSYEDNLKALESQSSKSQKEIGALNEKMNTLKSRKVDLEIRLSELKVDKSLNNLNDTMVKASKASTGDFVKVWARGINPAILLASLTNPKGRKELADVFNTISEGIFGVSFGRTASEKMMKSYTDGIKNAKNSKDVEKAGLDFQMAIFDPKNDKFNKLSDDAKVKLAKQVDEAVKAQKAAIAKKNAQQDSTISLTYQSALKNGQKEDDIIKSLAKKYKMTTEEIKAKVKEQKKGTAEVGNEMDAVDKLAQKWGEARTASQDTIKNNRSAYGVNRAEIESLEKAKKAGLQYDALRLSSLKAQQVELIKQAKEEGSNERKRDSYEKAFDRLSKLEQSETKKLSEIISDSFSTKKAGLELQLAEYELMVSNNALSENRKLNNVDEFLIAQKKLELAKEENKVYAETLKDKKAGIAVSSDGLTLDFTNVSSSLKSEDIANIKKTWQEQLQNVTTLSIDIEAKIGEFKIAAQDIKEAEKGINQKQMEFDISMGIDVEESKANILNGYKKVLQDTQKELDAEKSKLNNLSAVPETDKAAYAKYLSEQNTINANINKLRSKSLEAQEKIRDFEKAATDKQLEDSKKFWDDKIALIEKSGEKELAAAQHNSDVYSAALSKMQDIYSNDYLKSIDDEQNAAIKKLDEYKEQKIISESEYQSRKSRIEKEAQIERDKTSEKLASLKMLNEKLRIGQQQKMDMDILKAKKDQLEEEKALLEARKTMNEKTGKMEFNAEDKAAYDKISEALNTANKAVEERGGLLTNTLNDLQTGVSDTITNLFAGDTEGAVESMKGMFSQLLGVFSQYLSKMISGFILETVLNISKAQIAANPWLGMLLVPLVYTTVSAGVNALAQPLLNKMSSFATGGQIDNPTVLGNSVVGDANNLGGGTNREWIFRNDQLKTVVASVAANVSSGLHSRIDKIESLLTSLEFSTLLKGEDILISMNRTKNKRQERQR